MRSRDLDRDEQQRTSQTADAETPPTGGGSSEAEAVRRRAQRLLDLGDEMISQALSQNSERFLAQNRQQGGQ